MSRSRRAAAAAVLLLTGFQLGTALLGIDYGRHWDEHFLQSILSESVTDLDAWPRKYFYGSLYSGMGYLALAPEWFDALPRLVAAAREIGQYGGPLEPSAEIRTIQAGLLAHIQEPAFVLRTRTLFALAAALGIPCLFLAGARLAEGPWGGVVAAAVLGLSWEFGTHARHIAIDAILVALVALFLALLARFLRPAPGDARPERWLYLAAGVSGLATGAKFHALLLGVSVLGAIFARADRARPRRALLQALCCAAIAGAGTLAVNPGLLLDTVQVANDWGYTTRDYFRESDLIADPYRSLGFLHHLREASLYLVTAALSPRPPLGLALAAVAALGFVTAWRRDWKLTLALGAFVPVYVGVMSLSGLILVRNELPVLPVLAIFVMWGVEALLRGRRTRWLAGALLAAWVAGNATHVTATALTVRQPWDEGRVVASVREYVARHPDERFLISRALLALASRTGAPFQDLTNALADPNEPFDHFVYQPSEYPAQVPGASKLGYFRSVFGSQEVNYDYYPDWIGRGQERRAYVIDEDLARQLFRELPR
jgi:hypothetical protein